MTDYDDALLEDDILSLPDITIDEEHDSNYLDSTYQMQTNEESNNFLDLDIFDSFEEYIDEKDNIEFNKMQNFKKSENFYNQLKEESENICDDKWENYENNSILKVESTSIYITDDDAQLKSDLRITLKNNIQDIIETTAKLKKKINENVNETINNTQNNYNLKRNDTQIHCHQLKDHHRSEVRPIIHQSYQNTQPTGQIIPFAINSFATATSTPFEHNQYCNSLLDQPHCSYGNQNMHDFEMQYLPLPNSIHLQNPLLPTNDVLLLNQSLPVNSIFTPNQNLSMNQALPFSQGLYANQCLLSPSVMTKKNVLSNQNMKIMQNHYLQSFHCYSVNDEKNQSQYAMNSLYAHNNLNVNKILINRNFKQNVSRRQVEITNNAKIYEEILKNNQSKITCLENNKPAHSKTNYDPYLYFSDVWKEKTMQNEINQSSSLINKCNTKKYNKKRIRKRKNLTQKNINKIGKKKKKKQLIKIQKQLNKKLDNNNNKMKEDFKVKNEILRNPITKELMDPEMKDYCEKVEEQRKRREMFLEQKEKRRKILAMEKLGIKKESFINSTG